MITPPVWIDLDYVLVLHDILITRFGGSFGIRDQSLLDSALGKPQNLYYYAEPTIFDLATCYASGIIQNHPFIDGNKRTGFAVMATFLQENGFELDTQKQKDHEDKIVDLATHRISETEFSAYLQASTRRIF